MDEYVNIWGNDPADIDADEFCPQCEREVPRHYESCPMRDASARPLGWY